MNSIRGGRSNHVAGSFANVRSYANDERILHLTPSGLFNDRLPSTLWRPTTYLRTNTICTARDVYGRFVPLLEPLSTTPEGYIPLQKTMIGVGSRLDRAGDYERSFSGLSTAKVFDVLKRVFSNNISLETGTVGDGNLWIRETTSPPQFEAATDIINRHLSGERQLTFSHAATARCVFARMLPEFAQGEPEVAANGRSEWHPLRESEFAGKWGALPEVDHHDIVYEIVTRRLGVDATLCRSKKLRLMIATDYPAYIGLTKIQELGSARGNINDHGFLERTIQSTVSCIFDRPGDYDYLSVCLDPYHTKTPKGTYETVKYRDEAFFFEDSLLRNLPRYTVVGVWLPVKSLSRHEIGALPKLQNPDFLLVYMNRLAASILDVCA